jgi:DNA sulfur modification protein DndC
LRVEKELLKESCKAEGDFNLINNLLKAQRNKILLVKKNGLQSDLENILEEHLYPTFTDVYKNDNAK